MVTESGAVSVLFITIQCVPTVEWWPNVAFTTQPHTPGQLGQPSLRGIFHSTSYEHKVLNFLKKTEIPKPGT